MKAQSQEAAINKRVVSGVHVETGEKKVLIAPIGTVESIVGDHVTIVTNDGYRCTHKDILGAVSFL